MAEEKEDNSWQRKDFFKIKAAGMRDVLFDAVRNFGQNGDNNQAAAIALYAILSAIPLFILTIIAASSFASSNPHIQKDIIRAIQNFQPYFTGDILRQLGQIEGKRRVLGWIGVVGLVWLSAAIFNAIASALNIIFRSQKTRNYFVSKIMAFGMIPTVWVIGGLSVLMSYVAAILAKTPLILPGDIEISLTFPAQIILRYIIPYVMIVVLVTAVYRIVPTADIRLRTALAGSAIFALLLEIAKQPFTWYMTDYTRYHVIFGSLETVVILIIWVFYIALIFLFSAEVMSSYERRDVLLLERALLKPHQSGSQMDQRLYKRFGRTFPRGGIIFREGDTGREMFYILSGRVGMERTDSSVKKMIAEMGPGQYFGEMAALIDIRRSATARALEDSRLAVIDDVTLRKLVGHSRDVALSMLQVFSTRLKNSNAALEDFSNLWTRLTIILRMLDHPRTPLAQHIPALADITQKEPAEITSLIRELSDQGILITSDGLILDIARDKMWSLLSLDPLKKSSPEIQNHLSGVREDHP